MDIVIIFAVVMAVFAVLVFGIMKWSTWASARDERREFERLCKKYGEFGKDWTWGYREFVEDAPVDTDGDGEADLTDEEPFYTRYIVLLDENGDPREE